MYHFNLAFMLISDHNANMALQDLFVCGAISFKGSFKSDFILAQGLIVQSVIVWSMLIIL